MSSERDRSEIREEAIGEIIEAVINRRFHGLEDQLRTLTDIEFNELTRRKVLTVNEGNLTVFGHVCVSEEAYPKEVLRTLFNRADVNSSEEVDGHRIPFLHLAAYRRNMEAVEVLCDSDGLNFHAKDERSQTALHIAVGGGDLQIVSHILYKAQTARVEALDPASFAGLLNGVDASSMTPLHHAAWGDHEYVTAELLRYEGIDVNAAGVYGFTALHLASWNGCIGVVKELLADERVDIGARTKLFLSVGMWIENFRARDPLETTPKVPEIQKWRLENVTIKTRMQRAEVLNLDPYFDEFTALHAAACEGHSTIVAALIEKIEGEPKAKTILNAGDNHRMTALHHAVIQGDRATVEELLRSKLVRGNAKDKRLVTPLNMAHVLNRHSSIDSEFEDIIASLSESRDVRVYTDSLYNDRQLFVDAANAILVGAALIASITFAGWLQPPLGYQQYYETKYLLVGAAPPGTFASYAAVGQHVGVKVFWIFNSLSFFFAIATVLIGACVVLPMAGKEELEAEVRRMRTVHMWTTLALSFSVFFVLGAFVAAGFASLPPTLEYQWGMIVTTGVGGFAALGALFYYLYRVIALITNLVGESIEEFEIRKKIEQKIKEMKNYNIDRIERRMMEESKTQLGHDLERKTANLETALDEDSTDWVRIV